MSTRCLIDKVTVDRVEIDFRGGVVDVTFQYWVGDKQVGGYHMPRALFPGDHGTRVVEATQALKEALVSAYRKTSGVFEVAEDTPKARAF